MAIFDLDIASETLADSCVAATAAEIVVAQVADYRSELFAEEAAYAESVVHARAQQFATGRKVARAALRRIGVAACEIARRGRLPVWPPSVVGSIAHTRTLAAAIVGPATGHDGLGIDVEASNAVSPQVAERVLTAAERDWLPAPEWRTMVFSAKEALYKAVHPLTGEFLGFRDVELEVDTVACEYRAHCRRGLRSAAVVAAGRGHWAVYRAHWLVVFLIPASPEGRPRRRVPQKTVRSEHSGNRP